jgi:hypothetical protein
MVGKALAKREWQDLKPLDKKPPRNEKHRDKLSADAKAIIENMVAYGFSLSQIYDVTKVGKSQLRDMKEKLRGAASRKDLDVIDSAFMQAVGGPDRKWNQADGQMTRFWLTHKVGWRPPPERAVSLNANVDLNRLSDKQLELLESILETASGGEGQ